MTLSFFLTTGVFIFSITRTFGRPDIRLAYRANPMMAESRTKWIHVEPQKRQKNSKDFLCSLLFLLWFKIHSEALVTKLSATAQVGNELQLQVRILYLAVEVEITRTIAGRTDGKHHAVEVRVLYLPVGIKVSTKKTEVAVAQVGNTVRPAQAGGGTGAEIIIGYQSG